MADDAMHAEIADRLSKLLRWATEIELHGLSAAVRRRAGLVILDDCASMLAARGEPELVALASANAGRHPLEATGFIDGRRTDRRSAAIVNAAACGWCQLDEGYGRTSCHAGLYILPPLLAEAEAEGLSVAETVRAAVLAYEIVTRIAQTWTWQASPVHVHALYSSVGAASAIGLARRLSPETLFSAISAAATMAPVGPLRQMVGGALASNMYAAAGAWLGLSAVDWAQMGIGGNEASLHEVYGEVLGGECRPQLLDAALGESFAITAGFHKRFACCQRIHSAIEAALDLLDELPDHECGRRIERVDVFTPDTQLFDPAPGNSLAARFSFPHAIACVLVSGHAEAAAFGAASLTNAHISALRIRIKGHPYEPLPPWPNNRAARVAVTLRDGRRFEASRLLARGHPADPMSEADLIAKAAAIAEPAFPCFLSVMRSLIEDFDIAAARSWRALVHDMLAPRGARIAAGGA